MRRQRHAKIVATLGPASTSESEIRALFNAGVDVFRLNFSHGRHEEHKARLDIIRKLERENKRPIAVLLDLQGPKLRVGTFASGPVILAAGSEFRFDLDPTPGSEKRATLPHPEIFAALKVGANLLLDDGKLRVRVVGCGKDYARTTVIAGGVLSERKGVNVPDVVVPLSALTEKDRKDLEFGLTLGVDWVALSFVQQPSDLKDVRAIVGGKAGIMSKLEKPSAVQCLDDIVALSDAIMVARGDLGVELPAEQVPGIQRRIVRACRVAGKPVVVATQMLESMVSSPVPTRAEASDVATAVYTGADAVMLSAESASGKYPVEAVTMMDRIITEVERDPYYRQLMDSTRSVAKEPSIADAITASLQQAATMLPIEAIVTFTLSGYTTLRASRERPDAPVVSITPILAVARRLALAWGVHSVHTGVVRDIGELIAKAQAVAMEEGFAKRGDHLAIAAGLPLGKAGTTNLLHITQIPE